MAKQDAEPAFAVAHTLTLWRWVAAAGAAPAGGAKPTVSRTAAAERAAKRGRRMRGGCHPTSIRNRHNSEFRDDAPGIDRILNTRIVC
jgi:hypothetical protein